MKKCLICENEYNDICSLAKHIVRTHKITSNEYYDRYLKKENEGICIECGNKTCFLSLGRGYREFCSKICQGKSSVVKQRIKNTNIKKFGVENPFQSNIIKEKIKQTCLERYGVENPSMSEDIKNKKEEKSINKYGVRCTLEAVEIKEKSKQTNIEKYGVENPLQLDFIKDKYKQTCLEKYGVENISKLSKTREKAKNTMFERYGTKYYSSCNEFKEKQFNLWINEFNFKIKHHNLEYISNSKNKIKLKCLICNSIFNVYKSTLNRYLLNNSDICPTCFPRINNISNEEKKLVDYIKSIYNGEIIENDRNILNGQELDIYLPQLKIAFEFNGLYWHSDLYKDKNYHLNKTVKCEKQGIQLIHIFENEWINNKNKIEKYINDIISNNISIYSLPFKIENDKIIVDRKLNDGKILEKFGYELSKILISEKVNISLNNNEYNIYNCGYLIYEKSKNKL